MRYKNIEGKNRGEEGTTPVTTACQEAGKYKCAKKKKKKNIYIYGILFWLWDNILGSPISNSKKLILSLVLQH